MKQPCPGRELLSNPRYHAASHRLALATSNIEGADPGLRPPFVVRTDLEHV